MRALAKIQALHPRCHALIVGGDHTSYGRPPRDAVNWREKMSREVQVDRDRTHFVGHLPRAEYVRVLQISAAHVYLTYPFVLSWSLLEAMACGASVIASDTAPVREILLDGRNARLANFFDTEAVVRAVSQALNDPKSLLPLRQMAHSDAQAYGLQAGLRGYDRLLKFFGDVGELNRQGLCASCAGGAIERELV
ncbi:D-inositol-3-phosphate glycosyltransferase [compost metagenome]